MHQPIHSIASSRLRWMRNSSPHSVCLSRDQHSFALSPVYYAVYPQEPWTTSIVHREKEKQLVLQTDFSNVLKFKGEEPAKKKQEENLGMIIICS